VSWPLLAAALGAWALGLALDLVGGTRRSWLRASPYLLGLLGGAAVTVAGALYVVQPARVVLLGRAVGVSEGSLRLDGLAGLFLTLTGGLSVVISGCLVSWTRLPGRTAGRGTASGYLRLLGSIVLIVTAGDAFSFLFGWELLTLAFYVLTAVQRRDEGAARGSWTTLAMGKASGAALLLGFLLLAGRAGSMTFTSWAQVGPGPLRDAAYTLLVAGFGTKVGLVPFQLWLPTGYPLAPGPTRAALAGLAANVAFYGLWRMLAVLGPPPGWLVVLVLLLGGITALGGITFAAVQSQLAQVVAYSSVENAGIILVGYGIALAGKLTHQPGLLAVGLLAASLQVLAHAVAKSTLFASSAFVVSDYGTEDLERLRGIAARHPVSGTSFAIGSLTLAGLPPTIGFVSEWFILEALLQEFRLHSLALRLAMASAGALVALTAGVAAFAFIRLVGLMVLSHPPPGAAGGKASAGGVALDGGATGRVSLGVLAVACVALSAAGPWVVRFLAGGLASVSAPSMTRAALRSPWVLQPVFGNFSILSPSWLFIVLPLAFLATATLALVASKGGVLRIRRVPAWRSATEGVGGPDSYSAFGYANPLRHVLANILGARQSVVEASDGDGDAGETDVHLAVSYQIVEPVERYLYRPVGCAVLWLARAAKRLQSGRLDAYVAYMLVALVIVLTVAAELR
jgi:hydrogenase-4 component B